MASTVQQRFQAARQDAQKRFDLATKVMQWCHGFVATKIFADGLETLNETTDALRSRAIANVSSTCEKGAFVLWSPTKIKGVHEDLWALTAQGELCFVSYSVDVRSNNLGVLGSSQCFRDQAALAHGCDISRLTDLFTHLPRVCVCLVAVPSHDAFT